MSLKNRIKGMVAVLTALVGTLGTIIGIVTFATGEESLPDIINGDETAEQAGQTEQGEVVVPPANTVFTGRVICENGMPIRLENGAQGEVIASGGVNLKSEPDARRNRSNVTELAQYTTFTVQGTPNCVGDVTWWQVQTADGQRGWLPENEGNEYLLNLATP